MMSQEAMANNLATVDPNSLENHQASEPVQPYAPSYYVPAGPTEASWTTHGVQVASDSSSVPTQDYSSYTNYTNTTDPYGYNNNNNNGTSYANTNYYNGYNHQQQSNPQSYVQPNVQTYQNTGANYQTISSYQNTPAPYAGPSSYSSTYYNHGDYNQTSGVTASGPYNTTNTWQGGPTTYTYPSHVSDTNAGYYKQWADYYNSQNQTQTQTEVSCAPGTENVSVSSAYQVPGPTNQVLPPVPYAAPSWTPESSATELSSSQPVSVGPTNTNEPYWRFATQAYQNHKTIDSNPNPNPNPNPSYNTTHSTYSQIPTIPYAPPHQVPQNYPSVPSNVQPTDLQRINKMQIQTNPKIVSGLQKTEKEVPKTTFVPAKPSYISVSIPQSNDVSSSEGPTDTLIKPGVFPKSLRGYVERALARCKEDKQIAASQAVMKEIIKKATDDGTLYTKDWDTEMLFPLPNLNALKNEGNLFSTPITSNKSKRSPTRRTKSRWEPVPEVKPIEKSPFITTHETPSSVWTKQISGGKSENKEELNASKYSFLSDQKAPNRNSQNPAKRQRFGQVLAVVNNGEGSSDSDKDQTVTTSLEETKRRESRSKRFEKVNGNKDFKNNFKPKSNNKGAANLYIRKANVSVVSKNLEESGNNNSNNRAVEDIDWDSLTVKGTCREIEKKYLRLTSAPDPATVRPEEVLSKALDMVQNSEKGYLYKCDQLKSIRQDLTVQRIRNELTAKVYETHARLAIEFADLHEFNQCQSQLKVLYADGIKGCDSEFAAYNLLCVILHSNNNRDLLSAMSRISVKARKNEVVKHALAVRSSVTSGNYVLFFRLYKTAPNLTTTCLMDLYVDKMRYAAVKCMSRSYRPTVPVSYISQVLGFSSSQGNDQNTLDGFDECIEWLKAHGACLISESSGEIHFDTKASVSSLYVPEPEDAVSHGDAYLAVNDFFARNPSSQGDTV